MLPPAEYGRYTLVLSVLVYLALLATFGQDQGLLRYLPEVLARDDRAAAYDLLRKSALSILLVWAAVSGIIFVLRPAIDRALHARVACSRSRWSPSTTCAARRWRRRWPAGSR